MLPIELEDWLTEEGDRVVTKKASAPKGIQALSPNERLIYEVWLLDTEQRNGGLSQYFSNRGLAQWRTLLKLAKPKLQSFVHFSVAVNLVVNESADPYQEVLSSERELNALYKEFQTRIVSELRSTVEMKQAKRSAPKRKRATKRTRSRK